MGDEIMPNLGARSASGEFRTFAHFIIGRIGELMKRDVILL